MAGNEVAPVPTSVDAEHIEQILPAWPALKSKYRYQRRCEARRWSLILPMIPVSRSSIRTPLGPRPSFVINQSTSKHKSTPQASPLKSKGKQGIKVC